MAVKATEHMLIAPDAEHFGVVVEVIKGTDAHAVAQLFDALASKTGDNWAQFAVECYPASIEYINTATATLLQHNAVFRAQQAQFLPARWYIGNEDVTTYDTAFYFNNTPSGNRRGLSGV